LKDPGRADQEIGVEPRVMGIGPIAAIPTVLDRVGLTKEEVDIFEVCAVILTTGLSSN
jgi:acetyl-CoA acetyltransferase